MSYTATKHCTIKHELISNVTIKTDDVKEHFPWHLVAQRLFFRRILWKSNTQVSVIVYIVGGITCVLEGLLVKFEENEYVFQL